MITEKEILQWLEEKAAEVGYREVRITIENRDKCPIAIFVNMFTGPVICGMGASFEEALAKLHENVKKKTAHAGHV